MISGASAALSRPAACSRWEKVYLIRASWGCEVRPSRLRLVRLGMGRPSSGGGRKASCLRCVGGRRVVLKEPYFLLDGADLRGLGDAHGLGITKGEAEELGGGVAIAEVAAADVVDGLHGPPGE